MIRWAIAGGFLKLDGHNIIAIRDISPQVAAWFIEYQPRTTYEQFSTFKNNFSSIYNCLLSYYNGAYER